MNSRTGVLGLVLLSGLVVVSPYALYGGSVQARAWTGQNLAMTVPGQGVAAGSGAGGGQDIKARAPDCRSCARKGRL